MAKDKALAPIELPAEAPNPAAGVKPVGAVKVVKAQPRVAPKVSPVYLYDCVLTLDGYDYEYQIEGHDEADCKRQIVDSNKGIAAVVARATFLAKRVSDEPTNAEAVAASKKAA